MNEHECTCVCHTQGGVHIKACCAGQCPSCKKYIKFEFWEVHRKGGIDMETELTPELRQAVIRTLYHHSRTTPVIVQMLTGEIFETPPPLPTDKEKVQTESTVEELVEHYFRSFRSACIEILGEDPEEDEYRV